MLTERNVTLVERQETLQRLLDLTQDDNHTARVAMISAPVAMGKTALLGAFTAAARRRGCLVLQARGARDERELPLGLVGQLANDEHIPGSVAERIREAMSTMLSQPSASTAVGTALPPTAALLAHELHSALLTLARELPVVLCIDDVHHGDFVSLQILLYLLRRLPSGRLTLVLSELPGTATTHPSFQTELNRHPFSERHELPSLSVDGIRALLQEVCDDQRAGELASRCYQASGGNPLLVHGLIKDAGLHPTAATSIGTGEAYREAALALLMRLDRATDVVAQAAAVLGGNADAGLVGELLEIDVADVRSTLTSLSACGLLGESGYRHPGVRAAVLAGMDPTERSALRLRAARIVHDHGGGATVVAEHFVAAGEAPDDAAVKVLQEAAAHAQSADEIGFAIDCLDLAARGSGDERDRAQTTMALARLEWRNEPSSAARHLTGLCEAMRTGLLEIGDVVVLARWLLWLGRTEEAAEAIARVLAGDVAGDPTVRAELVNLRMWYPAVVPETELTSVRDRATLPASLRASGSTARMSATLALDTALFDGPSDAIVSRTEQVLADCELSDETLPTILCALQTLIIADRHVLTESWCEVFLREAAQRRAATWEALLAAVRGEAALRRGDLTAAQRWSEFALGRISGRSWGLAIGLPYAIGLQALVAMSRYDDAAALARQVVPQGMLDSRFGLKYLHARGRYHLATNRLHAAQADFAQCAERADTWGCDLPIVEAWRSGQAGVYLRLRRQREARALAVTQLNLPSGQSPRVRGQSLRVIAATSDARRRPAILREAIDLLQAAGDRVELAYALAELSRTYTGLGEFNRARLISRRALEVAGECGAEPSCRQMLAGDTGAPLASDLPTAADSDVAADSLSDAERRVAELAVMGHTNREIGGKLYITVSTVEQHLTRVYRKLGVSRRVDLPLRLRDTCRSVASLVPDLAASSG